MGKWDGRERVQAKVACSALMLFSCIAIDCPIRIQTIAPPCLATPPHFFTSFHHPAFFTAYWFYYMEAHSTDTFIFLCLSLWRTDRMKQTHIHVHERSSSHGATLKFCKPEAYTPSMPINYTLVARIHQNNRMDMSQNKTFRQGRFYSKSHSCTLHLLED